MRLCGDIKWIPLIELEPTNPKCLTKKHHHTSLLALNQSNLHDSRSRSSVSTNTVREESIKSYSIIGILNTFEFVSSNNYNTNVSINKKQEELNINAKIHLLSISNETDNDSSNLCIQSPSNEPSISYNDINKNNTNTSKLHQFLFDSIDTDSDDDDIFPTSLIDMNYKATPQQKATSVVPCGVCLWEL
eukprot:111668_1